jgi:alpha-glucosidase
MYPLGQLAFEELTDPQGIAFWPAPVGRDNTRTPMVWDDSAAGGFTSGTPWLPVKAEQLARNVAAQAGNGDTVLESYRAMIAFRKASTALRQGKCRFLDLPDPVLGFQRGEGKGAVLCVFNLSPQPVTLHLPDAGVAIGPVQAAKLSGGKLVLGGNGFGFFKLA